MENLGHFVACVSISAVVILFVFLFIKGLAVDRLSDEDKDDMGINIR